MASRYMFQVEVSHQGLNKYRIVKAQNRYELDRKASALLAQWDEQWSKKVEQERKIRNEEDSLSYAIELTQQADDIQSTLDNLLLSNLNIVDLDLNSIKDSSVFPEPVPNKPSLLSVPEEPKSTDTKYILKPSFFTKLSKKKMTNLAEYSAVEFSKDHNTWATSKASIDEKNEKLLLIHKDLIEQWGEKKANFYKQQKEENNKVDLFFKKYKAGDAESIEWYFTQVLEKIEIPLSYDRAIDIEYNQQGKLLVIDMFLPVVDDIPTLKNVSYIKARKEYKETHHSESFIKKKYDNIIYQIVMQSLNCVFTLSSMLSIIDSIVINGKVNTIDKATGNSIEPYVLSISVKRSEFDGVNLSAVDPKAWFKSTKGISATSIASVTPVAPIVLMNREDNYNSRKN